MPFAVKLMPLAAATPVEAAVPIPAASALMLNKNKPQRAVIFVLMMRMLSPDNTINNDYIVYYNGIISKID